MAMKKIIFILSAALLISSCSKLDTDKKKISYTIGQQVAENIKRSNIDVDPDVLARSIKDSITGKPSELSQADLQAAMAIMQKGVQQRMAEEGEKSHKVALAFLQANKQKTGVQATASGLQYEIVKEGKGKKPTEKNSVLIQYTGSLTTGAVFDSSKNRGPAPAELKVKDIVPGLKEGLELMPEGATYKFYLPPELAYGAQERPGIPAQSVLIFEVELLKIK